MINQIDLNNQYYYDDPDTSNQKLVENEGLVASDQFDCVSSKLIFEEKITLYEEMSSRCKYILFFQLN